MLVISSVKMQYKECPLKLNGMKLNEVTQTTTINNEFITLIDMNGNPLKISKSDLAEVIRTNMPNATSQKKGLMPIIIGKSPFQIYIALNKGLEKGFEFNYGLVSLYSIQKGYSSILLLGSSMVNIVSEIGSPVLSTVKDTANKINIYKEAESKLIVQNNTNDQFRFYISVL